MQPPPRSTLFPYTTLFRSYARAGARPAGRARLRGLQAHSRDRVFDLVERRLMSGVRELRIAERALHAQDRKSTRLNSSHVSISYAVFCLKKKKVSISISTT